MDGKQDGSGTAKATVGNDHVCLIIGCGGIAVAIALGLMQLGGLSKLVFVARDDNKGQKAIDDVLGLDGRKQQRNNNGNGNGVSTKKNGGKMNGNASKDNNNNVGGSGSTTTAASAAKEDGRPAVEYIVADLCSMKACKDAANKFIDKYKKCDLVICAAGESASTDRNGRSVEGENRIFASHFLGPMIFTKLLIPLLNQSSFPGTIVYTIGEQANYREVPDIRNLGFKDTPAVQARGPSPNVAGKPREAGSATSSVDDLQKTASNSSDSGKKGKKKRKSQGGGKQGDLPSLALLPSPYSAAKTGMICAAMEIARRNSGLRVALINPGVIRTNFHRDGGRNLPDECFTARTDDVADLVKRIVSKESNLFVKSDKAAGNVARMFKVRVDKEIPVVDSPAALKFGETVMSLAAQSDLLDAVMQHVGLEERDEALSSSLSANATHSKSARSVKSNSSGSSSKGKGMLSNCTLM